MRLICETLEDVTVLKEQREDGKKNYFIEGPFLMGDRPNRNGRIYESRILAKEVARYKENYIDQNRAFGELGHPNGPTINLDRVSHLITKLEQDGSNFIGKAKLTETPMGDIARGILESGGKLGVSSRGMGSVTKNKDGIMAVGEDFTLATAADIVADPSAHIAYVNGVMENVNWIYDAASGNWLAQKELEETKKEINLMTLRQIHEQKLSMFDRFLNSLILKS
jgi:hypothetical protein